ncbi:MAG TPA: hypothetical protein VI685_00190, partial [Candidatus Angelobacter sp.]
MSPQIDLTAMVDRALATPELASLLRDSDLPPDQLVDRIKPHLNDILSIGMEQQAILEKTKTALVEATKQRDAQIEQLAKPEPVESRVLVLRALLWGIASYVLASSISFLVGIRPEWNTYKWLRLPYILVPIGIVGLTMLLADSRRYRSKRVAAALEYDRQKHQLDAKFQVSQLKSQYDTLQNQLNETVYQKGILPDVTGILSLATAPSYATQLPEEAGSKGLSEVFTTGHEVETSAKRALDELMKLPGGSIGLAGPRGAGKTTLMTLVENRPISETKPPCSIHCSAPVEYTGRDFLVTMFVLLCKWVVSQEEPRASRNRPRNPQRSNDRPEPPWAWTILRFLRKSARYLFLAGLMLIVLGLDAAFYMMPPKASTQPA